MVDWSATSELPPERLVEPLAALESGVPAELVELGLWIADEYCSTPARGLALVLPPGTGTGPRAAPGPDPRAARRRADGRRAARRSQGQGRRGSGRASTPP